MTGPARVVRGVLLGATLAGLGLAVAEIALRSEARVRTGSWPRTRAAAFYGDVLVLRQLYRPHAFLNTGPREGASVHVFDRSASFNSLGYRSPERPREKAPGLRRLLIAGGSTTFDVSAPNDAAAWPSMLEGELLRHDAGVEVWNAGFPGWTSLENTLSFALRDRDLTPDVALLYVGINDLQPGAHQPFDRAYEHGHAELARRALGFELAPPSLWSRSVLFERIADRLRGRPLDPWGALGPAAGSAVPTRVAELPAAARIVFERNLRSFAALARDAGAKLVLATQPMCIRAASREADLSYLEGWYPELQAIRAPAELERLNDVTRAVASSQHLELADVAALPWDDADFVDPLHMSASGRSRLVAFLTPIVETKLRGAGPPS